MAESPFPTKPGFVGWPLILGELTQGQPMLGSVAESAMTEILSGRATPAQIAAFVVALRMKGETTEEMNGLLDAMLGSSLKVRLDDLTEVVDIVGTGGDRSHSINVSTLAAIVVAGAGGRVCKHGNRAASSSCGSADLLEALGVALDLGPEGVARCVREVRMGFCFAPVFHASMRHAGPTRKELGVPTVFNLLGPLANPARVRRYVVGVGDPSTARRMAEVLLAHGTERAMVVHGGDGLDEITVTTTSNVIEIVDGELRDSIIDPADFDFAPARLEDLRGGNPATNAALSRELLAGAPGPQRDIVVLNSAAALVVGGWKPDFPSAISAAEKSIDDGAAAQVLADLVEVSQDARDRQDP